MNAEEKTFYDAALAALDKESRVRSMVDELVLPFVDLN